MFSIKSDILNHAVIRTILLFCIISIFLISFVPDMPLNGDTYRYAIAIQSFKGPVVHLGYFLIGFVWYKLLSLFGINAVMSLNILSALCGAFSVVLIYRITRELTNNTFQSIVTASILFTSGSFLLYAIHGEVYVPQLCLVLLTMWFILKHLPLPASLTLVTAVGITPTSLLAIPALFYLMYLCKYKRKQWAMFLSPLLFISLVVLIFKFTAVIDIFLSAVYSPTIFFKEFSLFQMFKGIFEKLALIYFKAFHIFMPFILWGMMVLYKDKKTLFYLLMLLILPFGLYILNIGLISDDHLIISFIPLTISAGQGLISVLNKFEMGKIKRYTVTAIVVAFSLVLSSLFFLFPERQDSRELKTLIEKFSRVYAVNAILISDYNFGMPFWFHTKVEENYRLRAGLPNFYVQESSENRNQLTERFHQEFWIDHTHFLHFISLFPFENLLMTDQRQFYYADKVYQPSAFARLLIPDAVIEARRLKASKINRLKNYFENDLHCQLTITKIIESDLFNIYDVQVSGISE